MNDENITDVADDDFAMIGDTSTDDITGEHTASNDDAVATHTGGDSQGKDRDFVEFVVKHLVDEPAEVKVNRRVDELGVFITVSVAKDDMGKLIGKNGQTVDALRVLLRVMGAKQNNRVNLKVVEPGEM